MQNVTNPMERHLAPFNEITYVFMFTPSLGINLKDKAVKCENMYIHVYIL